MGIGMYVAMNLVNSCYNMVHDTLGSYSDDKPLQWHSLGCTWMGMCNSEWTCKLIINNFMEYYYAFPTE